jgi:uncharacterized protein (TIGR03084 family)
MNLDALIADLNAERQWVDRIVSECPVEDWALPTPAPRWSIQDQVWHLAYFDAAAARAIREPEAFEEELARASQDIDAYRDEVEEQGRQLTAKQVLDQWHVHQREFNDTARGGDPKTRVPWYGVDMSLASAVTARIMETWAHGVDIADTLAAPLSVSERLRHVAFLAYRAVPFSFEINGLSPPRNPIRVELDMPAGGRHVLGPADAEDSITGSLLDFCLVAVQRRHWKDTSLVITGSTAQAWIEVAQAFAGPPGDGRPPSAESER